MDKHLQILGDDKVYSNSATFIRVGMWGKQCDSSDNGRWSFELERNHKLQKITIDHGDVIYSLMFATQYRGIIHTSNKAGGSAGGDILSEVILDDDEEINDIKGTIGTRGGNSVISSLTFVTNKRVHGPFGRASECVFSIPWEKGSLVGFYGIADDSIDGIGVYLKADAEIMKVGTWGKTFPVELPTNNWSFELDRNHHLSEITISHGDAIYALHFTTDYQGLKFNSVTAGGYRQKRSVIMLDSDEEIIGIVGTVAVQRGVVDPYYKFISSISFVTNKGTHGPFGEIFGTPFTVQWEAGSFAGFYGIYGVFMDSIGVYLKATL